MCGRYVIISTPEAIRALFGYGELPNFPAALQRGADAADSSRASGRRQAHIRADALGLDAVLGERPEDISAPHQCARRVRSRKPAFRNAMRRRRCLIPTDGFYEWQVGPPKRPYFVRARRSATARRPRSPLPGCAKTVDRSERRGDRHGSDHHHPWPTAHCRIFMTACRSSCQGSVRPVARLRQCRCRCRRGADPAADDTLLEAMRFLPLSIAS